MSSRRRASFPTAVVKGVAWVAGVLLALGGLALCGLAVLPLACVAGVVAAGLGWHTDRNRHPSTTGRDLHRAAGRAVAVAVGVLAGCGLVAACGPVAIPILLAAAAIVAILRRPGRGASDPGLPGGDDELARLTPVELAREWRISYMRLGQARDPFTLDRVLDLRRRQLDEIERRDPSGYRRWVGSGNWVRCDSVPFLR